MLLHRTVREWRIGGSTQRELDARPTSSLAAGSRGVIGLLTAAALGAGLMALVSPSVRSSVRALLASAFPKETAPSGSLNGTETSPSAHSEPSAPDLPLA